MEKIKTIIDKNSTKEFIYGTNLFAWIALAISLCMIGLYITFGVLNNSWGEILQIVLIVLGGLIFILAGLIIFNYLRALKKMDGFQRTIIYDFLKTTLNYEIYYETSLIESGKVAYEDFIDYKETKNYVYLRLKNNTWLAIKKEEGLVDFIINKGVAKHSAFRIVRK